jgi:lactoylglutathione lyase
MIMPIDGLFETHLTVTSLDASIAFYRDALGLPLAYRLDSRRVAFFWLGAPGRSMLGVWEAGSAPNTMRLHIAFRCALNDVLTAVDRLRAAGIAPLGFHGEPVHEPVVIGWMPAASIFFIDPDGHLLEFVAMLPDPPRADLGVVSYSEWTGRQVGERGSGGAAPNNENGLD